VNLDLIKDWNVKMKSKKKQKKLRGHFLSRLGLSTKVKHASELLQLSSNWAFHLSEDVEGLQVSMSNAVDHLEELVKATKEGDMNLEQQKKIRTMLGRIRKYYRQMYSDSELLSVIEIVEDLRMMDELTKELGRVLANARGR
jgi:antirestriction protein